MSHEQWCSTICNNNPYLLYQRLEDVKRKIELLHIYIYIYLYIYILFLGKKRGNFLHLMSIWFKNWLFLPTYLYNLRQKTKSKLIFKKLLNTTPPFFGLERFIVRKFFRKIKEVEQWNRWKAKHYIVKEKKVKKIK